jgi:hypothetical protein
MRNDEGSREVLPPELRHVATGRQFRLVIDGRVVVAEGGGDSWCVYTEDDPDNMSGGSLDGLVVAELLGSAYDEYPALFDEWVARVLAAAPR